MVLTQEDLAQIEQIVEEIVEGKTKHLPTKDDFYSKTDEVVGEIRAMREEFTLIVPRISDHEDRITAFEEIHPQGTHL